MTTTNPFIIRREENALLLGGRISPKLVDKFWHHPLFIIRTPDGHPVSGSISFGLDPKYLYICPIEGAATRYRVIFKSGGLYTSDDGHSVWNLFDQLADDRHTMIRGGPGRYNYHGLVLGYSRMLNNFQYCLTNGGDDRFVDATIQIQKIS